MGKESVKPGTFFEVSKSDHIKVEHITKETVVEAEIKLGKRNADLKEGINTGIAFLDHMIEMLAWRSCSNIGISVKCTGYELFHTVAEDAGITYGIALKKLLDNRNSIGVEGRGDSFGLIDEALSRFNISFEGRAGCFIDDDDIKMPENVETTQTANMAAFIEGFSHGSGATVNLKFISGKDPHHIWESAFRGFGEAVRQAMGDNPWRVDTGIGVKGI